MPGPLDELADRSNKEPAQPPLDVDPERVERSTFWFVLLLVGLTLGCILLLLGAGDYGSSLFLALPFTLGLLIGFTGYPRYSYWRFHLWANGICLAVTLFTWLTGFEGAICIIMAYVIVLLPLTLGLFLGTAIWRIRVVMRGLSGRAAGSKPARVSKETAAPAPADLTPQPTHS